MEDRHSLYLTVSSTCAIKQSASNSNGDYFTNLINKVELPIGLCEVGIAEVFYTPCQKVFGYEIGDNHINLTLGKEETIILKVIKEVLLPIDITSFNITCSEQGYPVALRQLSINEKIYYQIKTEYGGNDFIRLSETFQNVFGFEQALYESNEILAENPVNIAAYNALPQGAGMLFEVIVPPKSFVLKLKEPTELTVDDFVSAINEELLLANVLDLSFSSDEGINIVSNNTNYRITPSRRIREILGTDKEEFGIDFSTPSVDLFSGNKRIIIYTNLVTPQIYNGRHENIGALLKHERLQNTEVHKTFSPVQYHHLQGDNLASIHLCLRNETGEIIPFSQDFTVTFHIRKVII
ncbi:unnamed protein product [Orchesella dallaii]|uniref:Uncharacterized protein n=1 Tax=Orchesella dallaii TaxID=48710 RepID=A0ABP1PT61_9HEXA